MNSTNVTVDNKWEIVRHFLYVGEGLCLALFNALIVLTIWRQRPLRVMKEYTMLGSLAFGDSINGLGTLLAGIHRLPLLLTGRETEPASGRYCLLTGHNLLWAWFDPAAHAMLIGVSFDRVLSVFTPIKYRTLTNTYAYGVSAVAYGITFVMAAVIFVTNWPNTEPVHSKICWSNHGYGMSGSYIRDTTVAVTTLISVAIYLWVPILYRNRVAPATNDSEENRRAEFQKRLNKTVTISCVFTFVFVGLPWIAHVWLLKIGDLELYVTISVWMFIIANINPILNLFIYYHKQIYFKIAFKALFTNKTLPPNLNNWQTATVAIRAVQGTGQHGSRKTGPTHPTT